jgi:hypothetical protein
MITGPISQHVVHMQKNANGYIKRYQGHPNPLQYAAGIYGIMHRQHLPIVTPHSWGIPSACPFHTTCILVSVVFHRLVRIRAPLT